MSLQGAIGFLGKMLFVVRIFNDTYFSECARVNGKYHTVMSWS